MAKKDEPKGEELDNLFIGGEDDDLSDMEYVQDENSTMKVETQPPETKEEAEVLADLAKAEKESAEEESGDEEPEDVVEEVAEVEAEAESAEESEEEVEVLDDEPKVPKNRFDKINDRMKTAEKERDELKAQLESKEEPNEPEPEPFDYKTKEKEAMDAMLEGDSEQYSAINEEIRQAEKAEYVREAQKIANQGDQHMQETLTFDEAGAQIEEDFPEFVEDNEAYNHDAREELMDLYVGYSKSGLYTRTQALQRAAAKAAKIHGLTAASAEEVVVPENVVNIVKTDAKKKAAAANAQPPAMESRAQSSSEEPSVDIASMSDEEFEAMPESTKRRARGDIL